MNFDNPLYSRTEQLKRYNEKTTINGVEISVGWDPGYNSFSVYFPQTEQVLILSQNEQTAKKVFDQAKKLAGDNVKVTEIFRQIEDFSTELVRQDDLTVQETPPASIAESKAEKGPDKSYVDHREVNGIEFTMNWANDYGDYVLYFPQAEVTKQIIRISDDPRAAKDIFAYTVALARINPDIKDILEKVQEYVDDL